MSRNRLLSVLLLAALATAGCSAGTSSNSSEYPAAAPVPAESGGSAGDAAADRGEAAAAPTQRESAPQDSDAKAAQITAPGLDRSLIRTASLSLTVPTVSDAVFEARGIVAGAGGYTGAQQVDRDRASMTLHVPSDQLDRAVDQLSKLGELLSSTQTAEDVTEQLVDVESRIKTQRASLDRVRALLAKAVDIDEIVQVEAEVTRREADLESLLKRQETLSGQVAVSTISLTFRQTKADPLPVTEDDDKGLGAAFADGWSAFTGFITGVAEVIARLLPFLVLLAIAAALTWSRWLRPARRKPAAATEAPHQA